MYWCCIQNPFSISLASFISENLTEQDKNILFSMRFRMGYYQYCIKVSLIFCSFPFLLFRFFGTIRLAGETNDHPCTPTFLQIYKILAAFSIWKTPKLANCSTFDGNPPQPLITISKLKELHQSNSKSSIQEIWEKLKAIIDCEDTDFSDFVDAVAHDYAFYQLLEIVWFFTQLVVYLLTLNSTLSVRHA